MMFLRWGSLYLLMIISYSVSSKKETPCAEFEFPTLDNSRTIMFDNIELDITFKVILNCSDHEALHFSISRDGAKGTTCLFSLFNEKCAPADDPVCQCPRTNDDSLYHSVLTADPPVIGTWTWSSLSGKFREEKIFIAAKQSAGTSDGQAEGIAHTSTTPDSVPNTTVQKQQEPDAGAETTIDGLQGVVLGAVYASATLLAFFAVIVIIVCLVTYKRRKAKAERRLRMPARDLYQGSNVSMTINNELYEGMESVHNTREAGAVMDDGISEEGDYTEIDDYLVYPSTHNCKPPPPLGRERERPSV